MAKITTKEQKSAPAPKTKAVAKKAPAKKEVVEVVKRKGSPKSDKIGKTDSKLFAVIETGGKQYRVRVGEYFKTEKISDDMKIGDKVVFDNVLLIDDGVKTDIGTPYLTGKKVEGELLDQGKGRKVLVLRYKPKSRYSKKKGHRQQFMQILITKI